MTPITIALDAGHGQDSFSPGVFDSGAAPGGLTEAELAFRMVESGRWVADQFYAGLSIVLTRDSREESAPLSGRTAEASREGARYLISCHLNSASPQAHGVETLYRDGDAGDLWLARTCQNAAINAFGLRDRGIKTEASTRHKRLAILRGATMGIPACLVEFGFITNPGDMSAIFGDDDRDERIAFWREVYDAILLREAGR